ncbi:MAG: homoserine dehydrogenase, partial [Candidatus Aenigmarchaeota archaeon]|nr:homoserine dehydrogenase [Candidatus Aenigmarchaeota archaeon]MDI6722896.1 homoserine dehydrogenase [Candidatus Aenigmarchaeota archaeon]
ANKAVVSRHMKELFGAARGNYADVAFEASVGGGIPIVRTLRGYRGDNINKMSGILNGTTNYILSRMEEGMDFKAALKLAQENGFAEANHELDTGGYDARDKLAILASLAYNTQVNPEEIYCEGITDITPIDMDFADKYGTEEGGAGYSVKLLATANYNDGLELHVYPTLLNKKHPLASVRDEFNSVYIEGELCGPQMFYGRGAGRGATTSAVISDILHVADNIRNGVVDELPALDSKIKFVNIRDIKRRGYVRVDLKHIP